jgi:hypothetical protein
MNKTHIASLMGHLLGNSEVNRHMQSNTDELNLEGCMHWVRAYHELVKVCQPLGIIPAKFPLVAGDL